MCFVAGFREPGTHIVWAHPSIHPSIQWPKGRVRAVIHTFTAATEANPTHTVLSVDSIGAYDKHPTRFHVTSPLNRSLSFVSLFYGQLSQHVWHDNQGRPHPIRQAEGGKQGDPLMPVFLCAGTKSSPSHPTTITPQSYCLRTWTASTLAPSGRELPIHTRILNSGKTRFWKGLRPLERDQRPTTPARHHLGSPRVNQFIARQLQTSNAAQHTLLTRLPALDDLQAAWL